MGKYFAKRLGMAILTIFLVACLTFLLMNAVPGSPWLSEKTPSETTLAALNAKYGLDKPVYVQSVSYTHLDVYKRQRFFPGCKAEGAGWNHGNPGRFRKRKEYDTSQYCRN